MIEENDFREWLDHPVTRQYISNIQSYKQAILEQLGSGHTSDPASIQKLIGRVVALNSILQDLENIKKPQEERFEEVKDAQ